MTGTGMGMDSCTHELWNEIIQNGQGLGEI
jgi:hypothetical protein